MEQNIFTLDIVSLSLSITVSLIIGFIIFSHNTKSVTSRLFLLFIIATTGWSISNFLSYQNIILIEHIFLIRLVMFFAIFQVLFFYLLMYVFPSNQKSFPKIFKFLVIPGTVLVSILTLTPFIFKSAVSIQGGASQPISGVLLPVFGITAITLVFFGLRELILKRKRSEGLNKSQINYLMKGVIAMFFLIIIFNFILPTIFNNTN